MDIAMENTIKELRQYKAALEATSLDNLRKNVMWLRNHEMSEMRDLAPWAEAIWTKRTLSEEFLVD